MLGDGEEGILTGALAVAHVGVSLEKFAVPAKVAERFPEYVWAVVISAKPQLNQHWLAFVAGAAAAMRSYAIPPDEDPYDHFFNEHLRKHTSWPYERYYDYVIQMVAAIDTAIETRAKRWKVGA